MEPNEALRELRVALAVLMPIRARLLALAPDAYKRDSIDDLIDSAAALDVWLSKGGWLPDAWKTGEARPAGGVGGGTPQPNFDPPCTCRHEPLSPTRFRWILNPSCPSHTVEPDPFPSSPNLDDLVRP